MWCIMYGHEAWCLTLGKNADCKCLEREHLGTYLIVRGLK